MFTCSNISYPPPPPFFSVNGPEQVTIAPGMRGYNNSCHLRAAVHHPFIDLASFDILYESADFSTLLPGVPTAGNTQVAFVRYFQLPVVAGAALVDISLSGNTGSPEVGAWNEKRREWAAEQIS